MKKQLLLLSIFTINVLAAQVPNYIPTNGLVGYWPFSGNANDLSGNGNNGTVNGAILTSDRLGVSNSAYSFSNSEILITNQFYNNGWANYSISLWFLTNNKNQSRQNILYTTPGSVEGLTFNHSNSPNLFSHWKNDNINIMAWNIFFSNPLIYNPINNLVWYNLVIIKSGNTYSYYVNGVFDKSSTTTVSALNQLTGLRFGSIGGSEYLNGKLDDICIWNRALTQAEITGLYTTLGTEQNLANSQITVYPNPAKEQITIDCGNLSNTSGWSFQILNTLGQEVLNGKINSQQNVVSLNSLNGTGVYLVKIYDASNSLLNTKKIVLN